MRLKAKHLTPYLSLLALSISAANAKDDSLSFQGYSGLLNIPNAHVSTHGTGFIQFSDQMYYQNEYVHNKNLVGSFGIFPNVEVGGRIAWFHADTNLFTDDNEPRDLSANIKVKLPFIPDNWFSIAIGQQDIGGEASYFDAKYAVISKTFGPVRIDAGYGDSTENQRLDGAFGGAELQALPWLSLIAEYDATDVNAGFRLSTPESWMPNGFRADLTVMAYTDNEQSDDKRFFALAFRFPLSGQSLKTKSDKVRPTALTSNHATYNKKNRQPLLLAANRYRKKSYPTRSIVDFIEQPQNTALSPNDLTPSNEKQSILKAVFKRLSNYEFERIKTGIDDKGSLTITLENTIFNHNELDAIGLALGVAAELGKDTFEKTRLLLTNEGIRVFEVTVSNNEYAAYINDSSINHVSIHASYPDDTSSNIEWSYQSPKNEHFKPRITLSPTITYGVATEYGVFDYSWGIEANAALSLWKGGIASITLNNELGRSDDFEKDGQFYNDRERSETKDVTIQQTFRYRSLYNTTYFGKTRYDYQGMQNLTTINSPSGRHKASFRFGSYNDEVGSADNKDFSLLSYRYYSSQFNASTEITSGKFWGGDSGFRVESKFWFGDNAVSLVYKDTDAEFIAITWNIPLTPRKDFNSRWGQIKGNSDFVFGVQTMINNDMNNLAFGPGVVPKMQFETDRTYLNRDRLSAAYVYGNLGRLREAYLKFR